MIVDSGSDPLASPPAGFDGDRVRATTSMWDDVIARWIDGADPWSDRLRPWYGAYSGRGPYAPEPGLPEPFIGRTDKTPALCYFGLNPGRPFLGRPDDLWHRKYQMPDLQSRQGLFASQIRAAGGYTAWVASGLDWTGISPTPNQFVVQRHRFAQAWLDAERLELGAIVDVELWPWHSVAFDHHRFRPGRQAVDLIDQHVVGFAEALGVRVAFTFGRVWWKVLPQLGFSLLATITTATNRWDQMPRHREIALLQRGRLTVVAEWHKGSAGPPKAIEVPHLRTLIEGYLR